MLFKEIVDGRTQGRTDDGRRTMGHHKSSPWKLHVYAVNLLADQPLPDWQEWLQYNPKQT